MNLLIGNFYEVLLVIFLCLATACSVQQVAESLPGALGQMVKGTGMLKILRKRKKMRILCTVICLMMICLSCNYSIRGRNTYMDTGKGQISQQELEIDPANSSKVRRETAIDAIFEEKVKEVKDTKKEKKDESKSSDYVEENGASEESDYVEESDETESSDYVEESDETEGSDYTEEGDESESYEYTEE